MLQGAKCGGPCLLGLAVEVERPGVRCQSARDELVGSGLRELNGTAAVVHRPADAPLDRERLNEAGHALDVSVRRLGPLGESPVDEPQVAPPLHRARANEHGRGGREGGDLRTCDQDVVRQGVRPAEKRPAGTAAYERQEVLGEQLRDDLVLTCSRRVGDRIHRIAPRPEPRRGPEMDA